MQTGSHRLLLLLAAGVALGAASACSRPAPVTVVTPAVPVQTAVALRQDVPRRTESIGTVQPLRTVTVKSQVDGIIAQIHFREGEEVKAGDLLVALDRRPFENSLRSARADLANAKAMADEAQADLDRYQRLDQLSAISKEEYVQYVTKNETARAQVQSREAAVANAELQLSYAEIRAPIDGRTGQRMLHEGAVVKANDNAFAIVTINQLIPISIAFSVPEGALDEIRAAQKAGAVDVTAIDRTTGASRSDGRLDFVDNTVDPTTGMITLKAEFPNQDLMLWPGRFVQVITRTGTDRDAIVVPTTAVQNSQNGSSVFVLQADQTVALREVRVLRAAGDSTLIASGVNPGETVVTDGQLRLLPGMKAEARTLAGGPVPAAGSAAGK